jgi:hypothetical protein
MVRFGNYVLPHAQVSQIEQSRLQIQRSVPDRNVAYHADQTTKARTVKLDGEIRASTITEALFSIELLRRLADDTTRLFDMEDGVTPTFNTKLVDPSYTFDVNEWAPDDHYWVPYSVTLLEVA